MDLVVHAGLHKSGTTSIQSAWHAAYGHTDDPWYPPATTGWGAGHHAVPWFLRSELLARSNRWGLVPHNVRLLGLGDEVGSLLAGVRQHNGGRVILSSEELDTALPAEWQLLRELVSPTSLTLLLTITRPVHRWFALWAEWIKHGAISRPRDEEDALTDGCILRPGQLEELVRAAGADRTIVRVVRTDPPEPHLPRELALAVGFPDSPSFGRPSPVLNTGIGTDIELLRQLNALGITLGVTSAASRSRFERERIRIRPVTAARADAERFLPGDDVVVAARREAAFLTTATDISVVDPHGELARWTDFTPEPWVQTMLAHDWRLFDDDRIGAVRHSAELWEITVARAARAEARAETLPFAKMLASRAARGALARIRRQRRRVR